MQQLEKKLPIEWKKQPSILQSIGRISRQNNKTVHRKPTKTEEKNLHKIAINLPAQTYVCNRYSRVFNDKSGIFTGMMIPYQRPVNHIRRVRRAFKSNGIEGVFAYCKPFLKTPEKEAHLWILLNNLNQV